MPGRMKGNRKKRVLPSGGSLYPSSLHLSFYLSFAAFFLFLFLFISPKASVEQEPSLDCLGPDWTSSSSFVLPLSLSLRSTVNAMIMSAPANGRWSQDLSIEFSGNSVRGRTACKKGECRKERERERERENSRKKIMTTCKIMVRDNRFPSFFSPQYFVFVQCLFLRLLQSDRKLSKKLGKFQVNIIIN